MGTKSKLDLSKHPYNSKFVLLRAAFRALKEEQRKNWWVVNTYRGDFEQLNFEDRKIEDAESFFAKLYEKELLSKNE